MRSQNEIRRHCKVRWDFSSDRLRINVRLCESSQSTNDVAKIRNSTAARTVARYRRHDVEISLGSDRRIGESPECNLDDPSSCQRAGRAPDAGTRRGGPAARSRGGRRCTYAYASVRPPQYVLALLSPHLPPLADRSRSFHIRPHRDARELSNSRLSPCTPSVLYHLARRGRTGSRGPFSLHINDEPCPAYTRNACTNGCGHIISTIDAIMDRNGKPVDAVDVAATPLAKCEARHHR